CLVFRRIAAVGAFIGIPILAAFLYISHGNPSEPDQPLLARAQQSPPTDKTEVASIVEQVETHLSSNPDDVKGWQVIAPVYMRMSRYADAVRAFESIIRLSGDDTERLSDLGEALVLNEQGMITARAQGIFEKSLALDKTAVRPRYFLALGLGQEGNYQAAKTAWEALLEDATPQSAWAPGALEQLNIARAELGLPKAEPDNKAAAVMAMSKDEQQDMIAGMVAGLASRLEEDPNNLPDWLRLIRSYGVLGRTEDAQAALQKALQTFETDQSALAQLAEIAAITGLTQPATSN
ncbi:MAG: c-type cytochrome biogenesis protein CcmI, partial [Rhizobiales bacterium]|nr:c-type cytochrome biogenesis protein CcmI [Hyphomicrobiales bacterium]